MDNQTSARFTTQIPKAKPGPERLYLTADAHSRFYFFAQNEGNAISQAADFWRAGNWCSVEGGEQEKTVCLACYGRGTRAPWRAQQDRTLSEGLYKVTVATRKIED